MRKVADRIGDRWSLIIIIAALAPGPRGFNQLLRDLDGVSRRMLAFTLRNLERDGLVTRTVLDTVPQRVDYGLSPLGGSLLSAVQGLLDWARAQGDALDQARMTYDRPRSASPA